MRFAAPRSDTPPPRQTRRKSTYGLPSDSEEEESSSDQTSVYSSSSDSFCYESEGETSASTSQLTKRVSRPASDQHKLEDMIAAIRLRVSHQDEYEEWEQKTRKDAFLSARHEQATQNSVRRQSLASSQARGLDSATALYLSQQEEVNRKLTAISVMRQQEEAKWREAWTAHYQRLNARVENAIKQDEARAMAFIEQERKKRAEAEKQQREAVLQARLKEEQKQQEENAKRAQEEERQRQLAENEQQKEQAREVEKMKADREQAEAAQRKQLGMTTGVQDWVQGRKILLMVKGEHMKPVKGNRETKSVWSAARRAITPKVGQLTNDAQTITRVSQQLHDIVLPRPPFPKSMYLAVLSSLAKAILLQAETEVTAEKRSAIPLAHVTANLLATVGDFPAIFWAKLCQRAGGWPCPAVIPEKDHDGQPFDAKTRQKVLGYREEESSSDYMTRVSGLMRVYFHVMSVKTAQPLRPHYRLPRFWQYLARLLGEPQLLETQVGAEIIYVALDVNGALAFEVWGQQWVKLLGILYQGCTVGLYGQAGRLIGGKSPEGIAARVRVQLEVEKLMGVTKA